LWGASRTRGQRGIQKFYNVYFLGLSRMTRYFNIARIRAASVSLLAAFVFLSTLVVGPRTVVPDCCSGNLCPIHHKHIASGNATEKSHADCEHLGMRLTSCSMSCSHSEAAPLQMSVFFLLPSVGASQIMTAIESSVLIAPVFILDRRIRPLAPPPRI
jgi:hypothetical protein